MKDVVESDSRIPLSSATPSWDYLVQDHRVHRSVYTDTSIFAREMSHVFAATWVFLLHESEIPEASDFRKAWIGTREVVITRDSTNELHVFANRCSHRGATVCREHSGKARRFSCPYHGWTYDHRGQLVAIPGKDAYGEAFWRAGIHLARPARVESYKGFVFATLNPNAPSLEDHLAGARRFMDEWIEHQGGADNIVVAGAQGFHMDCNWKLIFDNAGDGYHVAFSHLSLLKMTRQRHGGGDMSYFTGADRTRMRIYALGNGHTAGDQRPEMYSGSAWEQQRPQPGRESFEEHVADTTPESEVGKALESTVGAGLNLNIFPNLLFIGNQFQVIQPLGVDRSAVHWYATARRDRTPVMNAMRMRTQEDFPILGEVDDATNFEECQRGLMSTPEDEWVDISRHAETGKDTVVEDGLFAGPITSDIHLRAYFQQWKQLMSAEPTLEFNKSRIG